jgi:phosphatidylglycerophosphatase A
MTLSQRILKNIATLGPIGYLPIAPGTWGSLFAVLFYYLLKPPFPVQLFLIISVTAIGTIAAHSAEKVLNEKDSGHIVIDEFAGYAVSILALPVTLTFLAAAFLLFRFFDILKPPPVRWIERTFPGGAGVVSDDLMAGVYTNLLLQIWIHLR